MPSLRFAIQKKLSVCLKLAFSDFIQGYFGHVGFTMYKLQQCLYIVFPLQKQHDVWDSASLAFVQLPKCVSSAALCKYYMRELSASFL